MHQRWGCIKCFSHFFGDILKVSVWEAASKSGKEGGVADYRSLAWLDVSHAPIKKLTERNQAKSQTINRVNRELKRSKKHYYAAYFEEHNNNIKKSGKVLDQ